MFMTILGIILIVAAVFLIVAVLMQNGKDHNLSGTIAGAAETFFGKSKSTTIDKKLSVATTVVAIIFVLLVLFTYLFQDKLDNSNEADKVLDTDSQAEDVVSPETDDVASATDLQTVIDTAAATETAGQ